MGKINNIMFQIDFNFINLFRSENKKAIEFNLIILYISRFALRTTLVISKKYITDSSLMRIILQFWKLKILWLPKLQF